MRASARRRKRAEGYYRPIFARSSISGTLRVLLNDLKCCDKGLEVWQNDRAYVPGWREMQLSYFYAQREQALANIRALR
jgi:hypothetical protein